MLDSIRNARNAATAVLKPTARELEYGLALHEQITVVDGYGFGPHAPVRGSVLRAALDQGADGLELQQLREHDAMTRWAWDEQIKRAAAEAWAAAGVNALLVNAGEEGNEIDRMIKRLASRTYAGEVGSDLAAVAYSPDDIERIARQNGHCYYRVSNGVPLSERHASITDELSYVRVFFQLGVRMMHLTYNRANVIGSGCGEQVDAGLTDFGRAAVDELNRVGVIVDVAHSGLRTSLDAARHSAKPMVASHSLCHAVHPHIRAKTDEVLKAIAATGGFTGIVMCPGFLGPTHDLNALLDHVDHVVQVAGPEHVAIGSDVPFSCPVPASDGPMPKLPRTRTHWRWLWPGNALSPPPEGTPPEAPLSLAWTNFPMITVGLVKRGYSDADIRAIMGGNVLRVAHELWNSREY